MDSMGFSFESYEDVFCNYCNRDHYPNDCPSNPESRYFTGNNYWDTSHFNGYNQSWEDHPNYFINNQDHGTFTSPMPPYQDWNNTYSNTFDQSWEEQVDFSGSFQGDDFNNSFLPPTPSFEQIENFESLENSMNDFLLKMEKIVTRITTCVGEIIIEPKTQSQIPIPIYIEKSDCIGKDKDEATIVVNNQEIEGPEEEQEHLSNPSLLQNSEEVQQNANIVINPCFEYVQKEHIIADTATFLHQGCAENLQVVFKHGGDNQSRDSGNFRNSTYGIGEVMKCSSICAINVICNDQAVKQVLRKVFKHKWKEKHQLMLALGGAREETIGNNRTCGRSCSASDTEPN